MRKSLFISLLFFYTTASAFEDSVDVAEVRILYKKSATDEKACKELIALLSAVDEKRPLLLGYKASGTMMMAKYKINPISKMSYFKKGKQMLEHAIEVDARNIELRLLRFMAQVNAPNFLGYDGNIQKDKAFILNNISYTPDLNSKEFVLLALSQSTHLNADEKRLLKQ